MRLTVWIRAVLAGALALVLLETANWAVRDCSTGPSTSENCLWLAVQRRFGLPANRLLRAGLLEVVGLAILAGLYLTFRCLWPSAARGSSRNNSEPARTRF